MSINMYIQNKQVLPVHLTDVKKEKYINMLYLQSSCNDVTHSMWIKNLSRRVRGHRY